MIKTAYIASSIIYEDKCHLLAHQLDNRFNIQITRKWWQYYLKEDKKINNLTNREFYSHPTTQIVKDLDFRAIYDADIVIIINEDGNYPVGALVECGYALAHNKIVIFLGTIRRSAMLSGCIHIETKKELFELIKRDTTK